ncbi:helix-turn-helix domain-containing protein [Alkalihalobacterium alkalinitrilicum]|uniref:helix-turn-helix domain-containing protein n=1 Tax=Alkalihalobacterium alkalinitrilicum TaxID=427920 RepID=UPI000995B930|nr:helix-turn-helix transcriptional regulator [Alkalihalobacterium alkalinitrilicum]
MKEGKKSPEDVTLETNVNKIIGETIRAQRKKLKLSAAEIAFRANITRAYYGRIERPEVTASHFILFKVSRALGLDMNSLYKDTEEKVDEYLQKNLPDH